MSSTIYYFTGTGNSLVIARNLAKSLEDARIVPIGKVFNIYEFCDSETIGFVFPTYAYGLPRIVGEFVESAIFSENPYIFAVATNFGIPGAVLRQLDKILRYKGHRLSAGFTVLDERSSLLEDPDNDSIQQLMISVNRGRKPVPSSDRMQEIVTIISDRQNHKLETSNPLTNILGSLLYPLAMKTFKDSAKDFWTTVSCAGCGLCTRICPRENIHMEDHRPSWGNDCELCHACIQWCPESAVQYRNLTENKNRYRNPEVSIRDMILR